MSCDRVTLVSPAGPGTLIAFKMNQLHRETRLDLYNDNEDIVLRITICRRQNKIFFNDHSYHSLLDGWGQEKSVDLNPVDLKRWRRSGVTISVHNCSTYLAERYQILLDLTTVYYFATRFPGPVTSIIYSTSGSLSDASGVVSYPLETLPFMEREAITSGIVPATDSEAISHFTLNKLCAFINWDEGGEIRNYQIGPQNVLQEYTYSTEDGNGWKHGSLHNLGIILSPISTVAPIRLDDGVICVYYQGQSHNFTPYKCPPEQKADPNTGFIQSVSEDGHLKRWTIGSPITRAVMGSSIAIVLYFDATGQSIPRLYYQDPELYLREHYYDHSLSEWVLGDFNPGVQPRGTLISAEVIRGGDRDINVIWRDALGRAVASSWSESSGWDSPSPTRGRAPDGRDSS
ncbi:hypothetical protein M413DRAFT_424693 [Hebeloma cylindrosporum]|uniref:Galectin domain-containing protein n=1 Tax=Hebeloma cylindrosporum TaxID=76867 RepID=A0A0C3BYQ3_HEBCY|nr:hypothetical protein M413DRAFT_424693 [Hebeloma cylindrosporum h7]